MPYNNRNSNRSSRYDDREDSRGSYGGRNQGSQRGNGGRGQQRKTKKDQTYHPLFTIYLGYPDRQGKMNFSIKPYEDKEGKGTELTKEQWLAIASDMYDGEFVLRGSLWENEGEFSSANGNLRLTGEELENYPEKAKAKKATAKTRTKADPRGKQVYQEPAEPEDEEDVEYEEEELEDNEDSDIPY